MAVVSLLQPGDYTVRAALAGFKPTNIESFHLEAGAKRTFTLVLGPGDVSETVTVTADAASARTGATAVGEVFTGQVLMMTPVASRDVGEFAWQAPGAAPPAPGSRLSGEGGTPVNVAGARESSNNFLLDGVDNNDLFLNRVLVTPSLDAVQEFTLLTSSYDAEYGRSAGAQVNVVLKSGAQRLSGSAYEFFRDRSLEARGALDAADQAEPFRRRHQFGGTLGGPAPRLRGFFFAAVEGVRDRTAETRLANVPTAAERAGDFSASGVTVFDPFTGQPFAGNRIPAVPDRRDRRRHRRAVPAAQPRWRRQQLRLVAAGAAGHLAGHGEDRPPRVEPVAVLHPLYGVARRSHGSVRRVLIAGLAGYGTSTLDVGQNLAFALTQSFRSRVFHDLRVGWNRLRRDVYPVNRGADGFAALGMTGPALPADDAGFPAISVVGLDALGDDVSLPVVRGTHTLHLSDTVSVERGRHFVKAGGEVRHYRSDGYNHVFPRGQLNFFGAFTGSGIADVLLGYPTVTLLAANDNPQELRTTAVNVFVQDDWRVTTRLTVNAGLRYEFNKPPVDADDRMAIFDQATATLRPVGQDGVPRAGIGADWNNLAPRVGASWLLRDDGSWLLRGGYGIYYDASTLIENSALYFNPPYLHVPRVRARRAGAADGRRSVSRGRGLRAADFGEHAGAGVSDRAPAPGQPGIETRVHGVDVSARWVGASGTSLVRKRNLNQPPPGPGAVDERRPDCRLRRHPAGGGGGHVGVACPADAGGAPARARPLAARRVYLGQIDRRWVGVSGERGQRQHAAVERPARPRARAVRLRRPPSRRGRGHLGSARDGQRGRWARLAGQRAAVGAERAAVHAACDQRQQQHRQSRRAVRVRPARRSAARARRAR